MSFKQAYEKLRNERHKRFSIQIYHNDCNSEPFHSSLSEVEGVILDFIDEKIITVITTDSIISFSEEKWIPYAGGDYVSFCSIDDAETYCIIEFY